jgi:hypothetical protein
MNLTLPNSLPNISQIWHFLFPISAILSFCLPILTILHLFTIEVKYYPQPNGTALLNYNHANVTQIEDFLVYFYIILKLKWKD